MQTDMALRIEYTGAVLILVILLVVTLGALALIHIAWSLGYWFPIRQEEELVKAVIGGRGVTRMPGPIPCGLVAAGLIIVICGVLMRGHWAADIILWGAAVVFGVRGGAVRLSCWRKMTSQEPFATYDQRYYGPLCLALAAGLAILGV